jgi:hypothetical protein
VLAYSPVILLVKDPVPVPSDVFVVSEIVGLVVVAQTTPLAVMELPPSVVMFPPLVAVDEVIDAADTVAEMVAKDPIDVVKLI